MHLSPSSIALSLSVLLSLLPSLTASQPTQPSCGGCLTSPEVFPIATRWLNAFATDGVDGLERATTENVQYWNEGFTYAGSPTPLAGNRSQLDDVIRNSAESWTACTNITFEVVSAWSSCDRIAVRWRQHAVVSGEDSNATAPKGTPLMFSGIDLLTVDLGSRMVSSAETSADRINYYRTIGSDPFAS